MDFSKHFLPGDIKQAVDEFECAKDLLELSISYINKGDIETARNRVYDALRSIEELLKMNREKLKEDELKRLIEANGIKVVRMVLYGK